MAGSDAFVYEESSARSWAGRPLVAFGLRAASFVLPIAVSVFVTAAIARRVPAPERISVLVAWWVGLTVIATIVLLAVDRVARRLLPLAALMQLTMVFPDHAPSRVRTAIRAGSTRRLAERVEAARAMGVDDDRTEAAALILELVGALSVHDRATRGHSERVKVLTDLLAAELGIHGADRDKLRWAALVHDVGKLLVPAEVLTNKGALTDEEFALIKQHPAAGAELCKPLMAWLGEWGAAVVDHQEKFDGTGYPNAKAGHDISWAGRIVTVADVFEVITAARSYKRPLSPEHARRELTDGAGTHFDPVVVRAFLNISLGRLRVAMGPLAWLAQIPVLGQIGLAPGAGTIAGAAASVAAVTLGGAAVGAVVDPPPAAEVAFAAETVGPPGSPVGFDASAGRDRTTARSPGSAIPSSDADSGSRRSEPGASTGTADDPSSPTSGPAPPGGSDGSGEPGGGSGAGPAAPPTLVVSGDALVVDEDTSGSVAVLANDSGDIDAATLRIATAPDDGVAFVLPDDRIRYTPDQHHAGVDSYAYEVCDTHGACATAAVAVTITQVPDQPVANNDSTTVLLGLGAVDVNVLANDTDPDGDLDPGSVTITAPPSRGSASVNPDGTIRYVPPLIGLLPTALTYRVCDVGGGGCDTAVLTINFL